MNAHDSGEAVDLIETEEPAIVIRPETAPRPEPPDEPANPDAWLQWALVIGLLALFLICALLILVAWNDR